VVGYELREGLLPLAAEVSGAVEGVESGEGEVGRVADVVEGQAAATSTGPCSPKACAMVSARPPTACTWRPRIQSMPACARGRQAARPLPPAAACSLARPSAQNAIRRSLRSPNRSSGVPRAEGLVLRA
jgi:hypothetical protein